MPYLTRFRNGFLVGFGAGFVTRDVLGNGPSIFRPLVKTTIKAALALSHKTQEVMVGLLENAEDLVAEIRSENVAKTIRTSEARRARPQTPEEEPKIKSRAHKSKGS